MNRRTITSVTHHQLLGHTVELTITITRNWWGRFRVDVHLKALTEGDSTR